MPNKYECGARRRVTQLRVATTRAIRTRENKKRRAGLAQRRKERRGDAKHRPFSRSPLEGFVLLEQRQDGLRRLVRNRQGLHAQLLLDLQRLQLGAFLRHVRVDQVADARS